MEGIESVLFIGIFELYINSGSTSFSTSFFTSFSILFASISFASISFASISFAPISFAPISFISILGFFDVFDSLTFITFFSTSVSFTGSISVIFSAFLLTIRMLGYPSTFIGGADLLTLFEIASFILLSIVSFTLTEDIVFVGHCEALSKCGIIV